jgi:hypothetical protein
MVRKTWMGATRGRAFRSSWIINRIVPEGRLSSIREPSVWTLHLKKLVIVLSRAAHRVVITSRPLLNQRDSFSDVPNRTSAIPTSNVSGRLGVASIGCKYPRTSSWTRNSMESKKKTEEKINHYGEIVYTLSSNDIRCSYLIGQQYPALSKQFCRQQPTIYK